MASVEVVAGSFVFLVRSTTLSFARRRSSGRTVLQTTHSPDDKMPLALGPAKNREEHVFILNENLERCTGGKGILDFMELEGNLESSIAAVLTSTRYALMSHGPENGLDGPVNNFANFAALGAFQLTYSQLTNLPAVRVANPGMDQADWSNVLQTIRDMGERGFMSNYNGFRTTVDLIPFYIRGALVSDLGLRQSHRVFVVT
jgi:MEKHLA domain